METAIIVRGNENGASLQCLTQFLELRRQLGLSCESINKGLLMMMFSCFVEVENVPCFE